MFHKKYIGDGGKNVLVNNFTLGETDAVKLEAWRIIFDFFQIFDRNYDSFKEIKSKEKLNVYLFNGRFNCNISVSI